MNPRLSPTRAGEHDDALPWPSLGIAAAVGVLLIVIVWYLGPGVFGSADAEEGTVADATVTMPMECSAPNPQETVRFELSGETRNGTLNACGHGKDEHISIMVPPDPDSGLIPVQSADVSDGTSDMRRPVGLLLLTASCFVGGVGAQVFRPRR